MKKHCTILNKKYKVKRGNSADYGECDFDKRTILINKDLSGPEYLRTLIHECLHGLLFELKYDLDDKTEHLLINNIEEHVIDYWLRDYLIPPTQ